MPKAVTSTHASRNTSKPTQQPRARKSNASRGTQDLFNAERTLKTERMWGEINAFHDYRNQQIVHLANTYGKTQDQCRKLLANSTQYNTTRGMTLYNAIRHDLSVQAKDRGDVKTALDLNDDLADGEYERIKAGLSEADTKRLFDQLQEHRELSHKGVRATNKAAALDAIGNINRIQDVLMNLYERTGVRGVAMFTRGHPDDPTIPYMVDSDETRKFFEQALGMSEMDVLRKLEYWACTRDKALKTNNHLDTVRKEIAQMVLDGLRKFKNNESLVMEWANYRVDIVHAHGVELGGWPERIDFVRPSKLSAEHAREIHEKLKSGGIHWVALTRTQRAEVTEEMEARRAAGPLKARKSRADKGVARGSRKKKGTKDTDDDDDDDVDDDDDSDEEPTPHTDTQAATTAPAPRPRKKVTQVCANAQPASGAVSTPTDAPAAPTAPSVPAAPTVPTDAPTTPHVPTAAATVPEAPTGTPTAPDVPTTARTAPDAVAAADVAVGPNAVAGVAAPTVPDTAAVGPDAIAAPPDAIAAPPVAALTAPDAVAAPGDTSLQNGAVAGNAQPAPDGQALTPHASAALGIGNADPFHLPFDASIFDLSGLGDIDLGALEPFPEYADLFQGFENGLQYSGNDSIRLNTTNLDDLDPGFAGAQGMGDAMSVFSVRTNTVNVGNKRQRTEDAPSAPAKKPRKKRSDAGVPRGPRK
ncbi:hypothetical protein B0H12DRAFT_1074942 [Mycena haematopus]|nr:hypothetical protein B0H12DRAFT_1074942 [Mycena haematopus]